MPANLEEKVAELFEPMLRKRVFVALTKAIDPPEDLLPFVTKHLAYMSYPEKEGKQPFSTGRSGSQLDS